MDDALKSNPGWRGRAADYLALEHNVTIASAAVFLIGFGEELWKKFLPKYLKALGATTPIIGLFGTAGHERRTPAWGLAEVDHLEG